MGLSLDEVLLDASSSSIAISDGTDTLAINADGSINVNFTAGAEIKITDGTDDLAINNDGSLNAVVSATNLDIRDLAFATDKVDVSGSSVTVSATNLDIRDLAFATDKVDVTGSQVSLDSTTLAALENITVSATNLDIRDLTHVSDSVKVGDGTDFLAINTNGSINAKEVEYTSMKHSQETVTTTAAQVLATPLSGRREVTIQNEGTANVYMGFNNTVTSANGLKISKASSATFMIPAGVNIYMIAASGSQDVRFLELG